MEFDWDDAKDQRTRIERGFGFDFASLIFAGDTVESVDNRREYGELRVRAIGEAGGLILHVVFTDRGAVRRIISARPADKKERIVWHASR